MAHDEALADLVASCLAGDGRAFERLVDRFAPLVWRVIRSHSGMSAADAEDAFQLVFLRVYEKLATVREPAALPGWLATTARRECLSLLARTPRSAGADAELIERLPAGDDDVDAAVLRDERQAAVAVAFRDQSPPCQGLLRLTAADPPLDYDTIAELLAIPRGSIGPTRRRCLDRLRRHPEIVRIFGAPPASGAAP